jgi:hypothetical protein
MRETLGYLTSGCMTFLIFIFLLMVLMKVGVGIEGWVIGDKGDILLD